MRLILALAAFGLCSAAGVRSSLLLKKRLELLEELSSMLCGFEIAMRCTAPPLDELFSEASGTFADMVRNHRLNAPDIRAAWEKACVELRSLPCCKDEEAALLSELGASLGKSDAAGQLSLIALYRERTALLAKSAAAEAAQKGKLFRSLGMLCGIGAAIMII